LTGIFKPYPQLSILTTFILYPFFIVNDKILSLQFRKTDQKIINYIIDLLYVMFFAIFPQQKDEGIFSVCIPPKRAKRRRVKTD